MIDVVCVFFIGEEKKKISRSSFFFRHRFGSISDFFGSTKRALICLTFKINGIYLEDVINNTVAFGLSGWDFSQP